MGIMREILFRGKRADNGEWVEGDLDRGLFANIDFISYFKTIGERVSYEVSPETVGQYTGLCDKNGKKVFEGDVIRTLYANCPKNKHIDKVEFFDGSFLATNGGGLYAKISGLGSSKPMANDMSVHMIECEIIGNIHDNPELFKGGAE